MVGDEVAAAAFAATDDAVCLCTADGQVLSGNEAAQELTSDETIADTPLPAVLGSSAGVGAAFERAVEGATSATVTARVEPAGARYEFTLSALPSPQSVGDESASVVCVGRETDGDTGRGAVVLDRMTDAFFALDAAWRLTYLNERGRRVLSQASTERDDGATLHGEVLWDVVPDARGTVFEEEYRTAMRDQTTTSFEACFDPLDTWFEVRVYPDDDGLSVYFRDITERREQRAALEERERTLRRIYDVVSDTDRTFEEQVDALMRVGREVIGTDYATLSRVRGDRYEFEAVLAPDDGVAPGDVVPLETTNCERTIASEETLVVEDLSRQAPDLADRAGNEELGVACYLGAPVVVDGQTYGTFCFYGTEARSESFSEWEVTVVDLLSRWISYELERRRTTERLRRQNDQLEHIVSALSHDLRNPLNVAMARVELLDDDSDHADTALRALDRIEALVEDILAMAEQHAIAVDREPVSLRQVATAAWSSVLTDGADLDVEVDVTLNADESRLRQALENLFRNAVVHGAASPIPEDRQDAVDRRVARGDGTDQSDRGADQVEGEDLTVTVGRLSDGFYVADDGAGLEGDPDRVFEAGYTTDRDGTGFGLAIVSQVAEAHRWAVSATESESGGARFEFTGVDVGERGDE